MSTDSKAPQPWKETKVVGSAVPRVDAHERVSGEAVFTLDLQLPGMLHVAVVRCPHPNARVKRVETVKAEAMPGVHLVLTPSSPGADIPWHWGRQDAFSRLLDTHCRHEGEEVAAVVAETPYQAHDAARAVEVEYEVLPFIVDHEKALAPGAPAVHEGGNGLGPPRVYERGSVKDGLAAAEAVVERTFRTPTQIHATMELHGSIAQWDGDRLTLWDTTQGVFGVREQLARAFRLPLANVRVIGHYMGGGFGSKFELGKYAVIAALAARVTGRPVKAVLTREEAFLVAGNRPANTITIKAAAKRDGTLTALEATLSGPVGAYPYGATSGYQIADLYLCPNVHVATQDVFIHAGKARAFRAPAFPPCNWALEQVMDELSAKLGLDPVELRLKNVPKVSQMRNGMPYTSTGLAECLREGAKAFGWAEARRRPRPKGHLRRGVGMAAGMWGYAGEPNATAIVKLNGDGSANLNMGCSDLGTGTKTVMAMVVSEELGVPLERIQIEHADTGTTQYAPASGGSQTVLVNAPAVRAAALEVKRQLLELAAGELKKPVDDLSLVDGAIALRGEAKTVPIGELKSLGEAQVLVGIGRRGPLPADKVALPFAAQFAEVEVNTRTGEVRVLRMLAAQDSGRVMNRLTYENQVFGGITQGLGYALSEQRTLDASQTGRMLNANSRDYRVPTAKDVPLEMTCLPIDPHDTECNTVGAKGLGEPAHIPAASAIANAVHDALGLRVTDGPMTPARVLAALAAARPAGREA